MIKTLALINNIPEKRYKDFKLFLESPLFNSNKKLVSLLEVRNENIKTLEEVHNFLNPKSSFNKQVTKNLLTSLKNQFRKFIAFQTVEHNAFLIDRLAEESIRMDNEIPDFVNKKNRQKGLKALPEESLFTMRLLGAHRIKEIGLMISEGEKLEKIYSTLKSQFELEETKFLISKITILSHYFFLQHTNPSKHQISVFDKELQNFKLLKRQKKIKILALYEMAFDLATSPTRLKFNLLKNYFKANSHLIKHEHFDFINSTLMNYCIAQGNSGNSEFNVELFDLYLDFFNNNQKDTLSDLIINNFINLGGKISKTKKARTFLEANKNRISKNAYNYSDAILKHYQKEYNKSLEKLQEVNFTSFSYKLNSRNLVIRNFIHLNEIELALNSIESLRIFILRSKEVSVARKNNNLNHLKFLSTILILKERQSSLPLADFKNQQSKLIRKITDCKNLGKREFLLELISK